LLIYFVATWHITISTIPNCFSVDTQYYPISMPSPIVDDTFSFFEIYITYTWCLGSSQNTENEANLLLPLGIQNPKCCQLQGGFAPLTPHRGLCPLDPRWGLCPQTPVIGSRSALAMCVHPTFSDLATPLEIKIANIQYKKWTLLKNSEYFLIHD